MPRRSPFPTELSAASRRRRSASWLGLQDAGLVVGRDIDVIAKSTSDILDYVTPPIDSFHEDLLLAGETLAHFLMKRIGGVPAEELQAVDQPRLCARRR